MCTSPAHGEFQALGTTILVGAVEPDSLAAVIPRVYARLQDVDRALSRFRPDSELARIDSDPNRPWLVSPLFGEVLELALQAAASTNGWFDPTVRDALEAAGYDRSIELLERDGPGNDRPFRPAGQWPLIHFDRPSGILLLPRDVRLDFGGIGKGFAVDYALRDLPTAGGVLVSAGGDLAVMGPPPEGGWRCDVAPGVDDEAETSVLLHGGALATSGLGRRQWQRAGQPMHHLINPHTGRPGVSPWRIVTVAARTCVAAEVAAKVAWLMGEDGPEWVTDQGLTARFRALDGRVQTVGRWPVS